MAIYNNIISQTLSYGFFAFLSCLSIGKVTNFRRVRELEEWRQLRCCDLMVDKCRLVLLVPLVLLVLLVLLVCGNLTHAQSCHISWAQALI